MEKLVRRSSATALLIVALCALSGAQQKKELRFSVQPGATVSITNDFGPITVRSATGNQVLVSATPHSNNVEIDSNQSGSRVDIRSHALQKVNQNDGAVDYDVQVPAATALVLRTANGAIKIQSVTGDISVESDTGGVTVSDVGGAHVHVRSMSGPIVLTDVSNGHVELTSVSGDVTLSNVSGPLVMANTTGAAIRFSGDCTGGGEYNLTTHSGNIEVTLPPSASVDVTARSINGAVEDGFQLQTDPHPTMPIASGKSFAGHANTGASSLRLRSFSGKISVRKQ